jgi:WXG100 family type VII secretion target
VRWHASQQEALPTMATSLTMAGFRVDLQQLEDAIGTVQAQADTINTRCTEIKQAMQEVPADWSSPAEQTFTPVMQACETQMDNLTTLLGQMITRMQAAYQTYLNAEQTNFSNFQ